MAVCVVLAPVCWADGDAAGPGHAPDDGTAADTVRPHSPAGGGLRIYSDEEDVGIFGRLNYGFDAGEVTVDHLLGLPPGTGTTIGEFACDPATPGGTDCQVHSWDFSAFNLENMPGMLETATTIVPVQASETCSYTQCGFTQATRIGREDKDFERLLRLCEDASTDCLVDADCAGIGSGACVRGGLCDDDATRCIDDSACNGIGSGQCTFGSVTVNGLETVELADDKASIYLRAAVRNEAETEGGLGENESRICYFGDGRAEVPLFEFPHAEGDRFYMVKGDTWTSAAFACDANIFNHVCGNSCGFGCELFTKGCDGGDYSGSQFSEVVNEGTVTLPSGHTFDSLVVRNTAEFCVYLTSGCSNLFLLQRVRTVIYLWQVPHLGTVVRLMSEQNQTVGPDPLTDFTTIAETDVKFGLFPPRSITVDAATDTTVELSWDPGSDTHRIGSVQGDYRIYWNTVSGSVDPDYAFDSVANADQVVFDGASATISGLLPGTEYFFTVTALSDYSYPANGPQRTYESLRFPNQIGGLPTAVPAEVAVTTGSCSPSVEVTGVVAPDRFELCWNPVDDPCVNGYTILGANSPESDANYAEVVADTGLVTCHAFDPVESYFLVVGKGTNGTGPWGHYDK